jgi:hypothetical protein
MEEDDDDDGGGGGDLARWAASGAGAQNVCA